MPFHIRSGTVPAKEYIKFILTEFLKQSESGNASRVRFRITENQTPWPDIMALAEKKEIWLAPEAADKARTYRKHELYQAISAFTAGEVRDYADLKFAEKEQDYPMVISFTFRVKDLVKLRQKAQELGVHLHQFNVTENSNPDSESELLRKPLRIAFMGKEIRLTEGTIQSRACEVMFGSPLNTMIELGDLVDEVFGVGMEKPIEKWKSLNNALDAINRRVRQLTGKSIFKVGKLRFSRIS